jgi:hypothetical protein
MKVFISLRTAEKMYSTLFKIRVTLFRITLRDIVFYTEFIVPQNICKATFFYIYILSRFRRVTIDGYELVNGFTDRLCTPLGITSKYNTIINLYNS